MVTATFFSTAFKLPASSDFMSLIQFITDSLLMLGGFCIAVFAAYIWKKENLDEEISQGFEGYKQSAVRGFLNFTISILCPVLLAFLFIMVVMNNFFGISII